MSRLTLRDAYRLTAGGGRGASAPVTFTTSGVAVSGGPSYTWEQLTGFGTRAQPGGNSSLSLHVGVVETELLVERRSVTALRQELLTWVNDAATRKFRITVSLDPVTGEPTAQAMARTMREQPMDTARAQRLIGGALQRAQNGDLDGAHVQLEALVAVCTPVLGATASVVITARNNLAWTLGVLGHRGGAIDAYWSLLDDVTGPALARTRPGSDDFTTLMTARTNALRNLAMLHDPRWSVH